MKSATARTLVLTAALFVAACADTPTQPDPEPAREIEGDYEAFGLLHRPNLSVLTRNLYLGGDIGPILAFQPDPSRTPQENQVAFVQTVAGVWAQIQATDFPERARALAREVWLTRPDVIGVQEAATFIRLVVDATGTPVSQPEVVYDYLAILLDELARRGLSYQVATVAQNVQATLPIDLTGTVVQYTDHDAILVREGVDVLSAQSGNYAAFVPAPILGGVQTLDLLRGWTRADVRKAGHRYHVVSTHFETDEASAAVQEAQAAELIASLQSEDDPVILMGDLNALADGSTSATIPMLIAAGYRDGWELAAPLGIRSGDTCCHDPDLMNATARFFERIDYVMLGPGFRDPRVTAGIVGRTVFSKTASGLWPSDHGGIVARVSHR